MGDILLLLQEETDSESVNENRVSNPSHIYPKMNTGCMRFPALGCLMIG